MESYSDPAPRVEHDGDVWRILGTGVRRDGKVYCHLASTTRLRPPSEDVHPLQIGDFVDEAIVAAAIANSEADGSLIRKIQSIPVPAELEDLDRRLKDHDHLPAVAKARTALRACASALNHVFRLAEPDAEFFNYLFSVLDYYSNRFTYEGERTGGVLQGCPRGPAPTPDQLTHEAEKAKERLRAWYHARASEVVPEDRMTGPTVQTGFFIGGPSATATVYEMEHAEKVIEALCACTGDSPDDYTVTDLSQPPVHGALEAAAEPAR